MSQNGFLLQYQCIFTLILFICHLLFYYFPSHIFSFSLSFNLSLAVISLFSFFFFFFGFFCYFFFRSVMVIVMMLCVILLWYAGVVLVLMIFYNITVKVCKFIVFFFLLKLLNSVDEVVVGLFYLFCCTCLVSVE